MKQLKNSEIWFITGSQHLYGEKTLLQVKNNSENIVRHLNNSSKFPMILKFKSVVTTSDMIYKVLLSANNSEKCIGIIAWMHTFSPGKMWISGLRILNKPLLHLHTQFNRDIPWNDIDMDFMNLNQSAHGGREFGFICTRLKIKRKIVVGYWKDNSVLKKITVWMRAALAFNKSQALKIFRFGDNMRNVAVTEGDKVEAQIKFGWEINYYGIGDLVESMKTIAEKDIDRLYKEYKSKYIIASDDTESIRYQARIELGLKKFLDKNNSKAFTTNFEDLHGLKQLPGLAVQRLMEQGYGFGAEGDWKQSALVYLMKVMGEGLNGGCSFMEDYTYHFDPAQPAVLSAHMLEICPTISENKPQIEVHPLGIGGKDDPARMIFNVPEGKGLNATLVDMGGRMRMIVNTVKVIKSKALPKLPVARALMVPEPDLKTSATAWILAGGAHHTSFSMALNIEYMEDFAEMVGIEFLVIDDKTNIQEFKKELRYNDVYFQMNK